MLLSLYIFFQNLLRHFSCHFQNILLKKSKSLSVILVFTIIGALNWGLIGLFDFNLVETMFGADNVITRIVYVLVGIAGIINISLLFEDWDD